MEFSIYIRSYNLGSKKENIQMSRKCTKNPPGFQIRKKYSNRCFRKFDRQFVGLYLFHLFIFWSKGKMLLFLTESQHSVDKGDYTLIQKTGFLVRRTQSFTPCLALTDWKSASYESVCLHGGLELMWVYSSGSEININFQKAVLFFAASSNITRLSADRQFRLQ